MTCQLFAVCFDARRPLRLAQFWAGMLGREVVEDAGGVLLPGEDTQLGLRFVPSRAEKAGQNRLHLHLTSASPSDQQHTVAAALGLGAGHLDVGQRPEEGHVVLADPEGNEFCVIEPGNNFLAGCGFLGEVACDGTREVGLFWSAGLAAGVGSRPGDRDPVPVRRHEGRVGRPARGAEVWEESAAFRARSACPR
jgi:hypothetical protein